MIVGKYCGVHTEPHHSNIMTPGTHDAIDLGTPGNLNGNYKLLCLYTGRILKRRKCTKYPMIQRIISTVNKWENRIWGQFGV